MAATPQPDHLSSLEERLSQLERLLQTQAERMATQEAEISAQREEIARLRTPATPPIAMPLPIPPALPAVEPAPGGDAAERPADQRRKSRRSLLKLGGAAAAAGVAAVAASATELAHPGTAHAQLPDAFFNAAFSASANNNPNQVAIEGDGSNGAFGVYGFTDSATAVVGAIQIPNAIGTGVAGIAQAGIGVVGASVSSSGVKGSSSVGPGIEAMSTSAMALYAHSQDGEGVFATSTNDTGVSGHGGAYGGYFRGGRAAIWLGGSTFVGAPTTGQHLQGEIHLDAFANVAVCTSGNGTGVGTWARLVSVAYGVPGGALNYLAAPIRIFDSRAGQPAPLPASKGALSGNTTYTIQVTGTDVGGIHVPAGAVGVFGNLTVTNTQNFGDLILYPHGAPQPLTSNINYGPSQTIANSFNVGLDPTGAVDLFVHVSGTDVIIDIAGYVM